MADYTIDFNTMIANFERTAALQAENCRKEASDIRNFESSTGWDQVDKTQEFAAKQKEAQAMAWEERAKVAREGYLLVDVNDTAWQFNNAALIEAAAQADRVKYGEYMQSAKQ